MNAANATNKTGIVGYGASIPRMRISITEIARVWGKNGEQTAASLGVQEKAIASLDEDSCTLAVAASRKAVASARIDAQRIGAVYVGSESKPYAVKPTASIVAEAIGATPNLTAADLEFACKAGTAGIQACMGMCVSGMIEYGLAIGSDTSQGRPGDALEFSTGCGAGAFLIGAAGEALAVIDATASVTTDTPDFWRRQHEEFPSHGGRFTGKPAYFKHVIGAANASLPAPLPYDTASTRCPGRASSRIAHNPIIVAALYVFPMNGVTSPATSFSRGIPSVAPASTGNFPFGWWKTA